MTTFPAAERRLLSREAGHLVDVLQGRADATMQKCHYLIVERPNLASATGPASEREIEQYRDLERVIANAADCETGERSARWVGAFTAVYRDGKLVAVAMVNDMPLRVKAEIEKRPADRLNKLRGRNMLRAAE